MDAFNGRVHWGFALILWILIQMGVKNHFLNPIPFLIGSVFPDADIRYSMIGKFIPLWLFFNHRGFIHSLAGLVVCSMPVLYFFSLETTLLFAAGFLLHLMLDDTTPMGIKWKLGHKRRTRIS